MSMLPLGNRLLSAESTEHGLHTLLHLNLSSSMADARRLQGAAQPGSRPQAVQLSKLTETLKHKF